MHEWYVMSMTSYLLMAFHVQCIFVCYLTQKCCFQLKQ